MAKNGFKEEKKPTAAQLKQRIDRAVLHIERTKDLIDIYFYDKGLRITITDDVAIVGTFGHRHVFNSVVSSGISRPYLYLQRVVGIVEDNKEQVITKDGYSYGKLFETLKAKEDKTEFNILWYCDLWLQNIFAPLYSIGESIEEAFLVFEDNIHITARNQAILEERNEDITNKGFVSRVTSLMNEYMADMKEDVVFPRLTDEMRAEQEAKAMEEELTEQVVKDAVDSEPKNE